MTLKRRLTKLEERIDTGRERVDQLLDRMQLRAEVQMHPELVAAVERANEAARAAGISERDLPELSDDARQLAERDSADQAAADKKRSAQLAAQGVINGDEWRARGGGITPDPSPVIAEARKQREQQQQDDAGGGNDGCSEQTQSNHG